MKILRRLTKQAVAHFLVLCGAAGAAVGTALIYVPAGMILGGVLVAAWALLVFDVDANS